MFEILKKMIKKFIGLYVTSSRQSPEISATRDIPVVPNRDISPSKPIIDSFSCPYCGSQKFVKKGMRVKKLETVQLYLCLSCKKVFTPHSTKGKHYPLSVIFDAISIYNLGYSLEDTCRIMEKRMQNNNFIQPSTLSGWLEEFAEYIKFSRMRDYTMKLYPPKDQIIHATLVHQQLYRYMFHKAKCELIIKGDFEHRNYWPLKEFLEAIPYECPHQYFMEGLRASEAPLTFSKKQMIVRSKTNYANKMAAFVLQSPTERKDRHETLQKFMLANDSVTVAVEVPVYLTKDDLLHMQTQLGFDIFNNETMEQLNNLPKLITGHIDMIQIRNGQIHILDYKPNAAKERPIEQLTLYAMALSRLTGLRMFEFKCAWFDEKDYFEFYPLHVIHKLKRARRRKIETIEGVYKINQNPDKIENLKPIERISL